MLKRLLVVVFLVLVVMCGKGQNKNEPDPSDDTQMKINKRLYYSMLDIESFFAYSRFRISTDKDGKRKANI